MEATTTTSEPTGSQPICEPTDCDLVMKGGITSGVVYPSAVLDLKERYRFRNIGGASAGAIAAVVTAAAEYGRDDGQGHGYDALEQIVGELGKEGFLLGLFQPAPAMRPAFDLLIGSLTGSATSAPPPSQADVTTTPGRPSGRLRAFVRKVGPTLRVALMPQARKAARGAAAAAIAWLILAVVAWEARLIPGPAHWSGGAIALMTAGFLVWVALGAALGALTGLVATFRTVYHQMEDHGFGLCPGPKQEGFDQAGLTDWLHERIQQCANLGSDEPLTFGHLEGRKIHLETVTTNLNYGRPFRLPFEEDRFYFKPEELLKVFPPDVVTWMQARAAQLPARDGLCPMPPRADLPVLVAARMSLSFPVLISAVPLYSVDEANPEKPIVANWFSDGGISSNFPVHFFDGWLPGRPTFGLSLNPYPTDPHGAPLPEEVRGAATSNEDDWATGDVFMPSSRTDGQYPRWTHVKGLGGFLQKILDTMENWRDNMQSELPGFRDRICEIRLDDQEGGMHLTMPPDKIADLVKKGRMAGERLRRHFNWEQHRWTRYLMLMETLQVRLEGDETHPSADSVHGRFAQCYAAILEDGPPDVHDYVSKHDHKWCVAADEATKRLLTASGSWQTAAEPVRFDLDEDRFPAWVMRITPKV